MNPRTSGDGPLRVAFTLEQCWNPSPGGTATAAVRLATALLDRPAEVELVLVAGRHATVPPEPFRPPGPVHMLPLARPWLYETWVRFGWPKVEAVTGPIDVAHATGLIPCGTDAPQVVTLHDIAFVHAPEQFTTRGVRSMTRALRRIERRADLVVVPSRATLDDCVGYGIDPSRLRLVPLGVDGSRVTSGDVERVRRRYRLPDQFVLFVGTIEPRKNLRRLAAAMRHTAHGLPLVVAGAAGWGEHGVDGDDRDATLWLGFVPEEDLAGLYAAASVFAYPSEREGFGLPVAEAMVQATPVVTSHGTSTEEVAGGAAVLVDPFDVESIAAGVDTAVDDADQLAVAGLRRAGELSWAACAERTLAVYAEAAGAGA